MCKCEKLKSVKKGVQVGRSQTSDSFCKISFIYTLYKVSRSTNSLPHLGYDSFLNLKKVHLSKRRPIVRPLHITRTTLAHLAGKTVSTLSKAHLTIHKFNSFSNVVVSGEAGKLWSGVSDTQLVFLFTHMWSL